MQIELDFGSLQLDAILDDTPIARQLFAMLPLKIDLTYWGDELYGDIGQDLGLHQPKPRVPEGTLGYTNRGNCFCVFFGQQPAWSVDVLGKLTDDWEALRGTNFKTLTIRTAD